MKDASWINIHNFGGTDVCKPVIEVRTMGGYGARWSAVWKENVLHRKRIRFEDFWNLKWMMVMRNGGGIDTNHPTIAFLKELKQSQCKIKLYLNVRDS